MRSAVVTLVAPIGGVAKEELDCEDVRQYRRATTGGNLGAVRLWDVASRAHLGPALSYYGEYIGTVAFSPDSRGLATSNGEGAPAVRLWDRRWPGSTLSFAPGPGVR